MSGQSPDSLDTPFQVLLMIYIHINISINIIHYNPYDEFDMSLLPICINIDQHRSTYNILHICTCVVRKDTATVSLRTLKKNLSSISSMRHAYVVIGLLQYFNAGADETKENYQYCARFA